MIAHTYTKQADKQGCSFPCCSWARIAAGDVSQESWSCESMVVDKQHTAVVMYLVSLRRREGDKTSSIFKKEVVWKCTDNCND